MNRWEEHFKNMKNDVGLGLLVYSLSMICLACTLPHMYNLGHVVFGTVIPTSLYIFCFNTCGIIRFYHLYVSLGMAGKNLYREFDTQ